MFYERWYTQLQRLPPEEKLQMYEAICKYAFGIETDEMAYYLESLMDNIRIAIDNDKDKQEAYIEQRRKAIASRWKKNKNTKENESIQNDTKQCDTMQSNTNVYERIKIDTKGNESIQSDTSEYNNKNKNKNKNKNENKNKNKKDDDDESSSIEPSPSSSPSQEDEFSFLKREVEDLRQDNSWLEIVAMQFHLTKMDVIQKTNEFETNCIMNGQKNHNGSGDLKTHFCNWLRINLRQNKYASNYDRPNQDELERQKRDAEFAEYARKKMLSDEQSDELPFDIQDG